MLITLALTVFVVTNIIVTWNLTNFPLHISSLIFKKIIPEEATFDRDAWENWLIIRFGLLGELFVCPICLGHWVSLTVGTVFYFLPHTQLPFWYPVLCMFSIPWVAYFFLKKLSS